MGLSARHVGELVRELSPLVRGSSVLELRPLPPRDLALILAPATAADPGPRRSKLALRLSADPEGARVHLQLAPARRREGSVDPFFAQAESALGGAELTAIEQVAEDRVVRCSFRRE